MLQRQIALALQLPVPLSADSGGDVAVGIYTKRLAQGQAYTLQGAMSSFKMRVEQVPLDFWQQILWHCTCRAPVSHGVTAH